MCDLSSMFGGGADTTAADAATATAKESARQALEAQLRSTSDANATADSNSENSRVASEAAMRRLAAGAMFGAGGTAATANNGAVFTRSLFGQ